jgi:chromosome segregation ATPase
MEAHELEPNTQVVPLSRLRALQADFDKLADARDRLSADLVIAEFDVEALRQERNELAAAMAALETVAARLAAEKRDLEQQRENLIEVLGALETVAERLGAQVRDLQLQRDELIKAISRIVSDDSALMLAWSYCEELTPAERARGAEERTRTAGSSISLTCRICGDPLEEYEPTCARCDRDAAADEALYSRTGH